MRSDSIPHSGFNQPFKLCCKLWGTRMKFVGFNWIRSLRSVSVSTTLGHALKSKGRQYTLFQFYEIGLFSKINFAEIGLWIGFRKSPGRPFVENIRENWTEIWTRAENDRQLFYFLVTYKQKGFALQHCIIPSWRPWCTNLYRPKTKKKTDPIL